MDAATRCAVHPARPAADECEVCGRPRCASDAAEIAVGCAACRGTVRRAGPRPLDLPALLGGATACQLAVPVLAAIASQYVGARYFDIVTPFLVGICLGIAAEAGARKAHGLPLRLATVGYALVATAYGFLFVPGPQSAFSPASSVAVPYAAAALGAWLWTAPPRRKAPAPPPQSAADSGSGDLS